MQTGFKTELLASFYLWRIWFVASIYRIVLSYRRTRLGTLWLLIGLSAVVVVKAIVFTGVLQVPADRMLPNLAIGMVVWRLLAGVINASCNSLLMNKATFEQGYHPLFVPALGTISAQMFSFAHGIVPMIAISAFFMTPSLSALYLFIPALFIILLALLPTAFLLGVLCLRQRDLANLVNSLISVMFFLTPVIWLPEMARGPYEWLLYLNPFFHFIEIVRDPIAAQPIDPVNWIAAIGMALGCWVLAALVYAIFNRKVLYWL